MTSFNNRRFYGAAGATIVAVATTARYIAKWRRHRSQRRGGGERGVGGGRVSIGLDLTDPTAESPRPCDYAVLDGDLVCTFGQWEQREDGAGIIPDIALGRSFVLAIDGPQGLAGAAGATVRESERLVNAPGRTPYEMPAPGAPYAGFIAGSVRLFHRLATSSSRFRLLGFDDAPASDATLLEVFPGGAWRLLAGGRTLARKASRRGREQRAELLMALGVQLPDGLPTHDQLDAAAAAWTAYKFRLGEYTALGNPPVLDAGAGVIREGYIVQPAEAESEPGEDAVAPV